jgi:hypothetical protein
MKFDVSRTVSDYIFEVVKNEADRVRDEALMRSLRGEACPAELVKALIISRDAVTELEVQQPPS